MEYKLDKIDKQILSELDKNCRISDSELGKKIRRSRQTVAYRINQLIKNGILTGFTTSINPNKMGFQLFKVYIKLKNIPNRKEVLIDSLRKFINIYWMGECDGSWDLIFAAYSDDIYVFYDLKNKIISEFKDIIIDFYGDWLLDVKQYPKMYFNNELCKPVEFAGKIIQNKLDKTDQKILEYLISNARSSTVEIARYASTNPTTVISKIKRMEKLEIILQYRVQIDLIKLNLEHYKAMIKIDSYTKEEEKMLLEYCSQIPQIQYFIRNIWRIELEFVIKNYDEYYGIIKKLKEKFPNVINTIDSVILRTDEWTPGYNYLIKK
ncbi:MAG: Lrp/AsnC family transcriptional regulator [Candidatus Micrarchaeia archaeon]